MERFFVALYKIFKRRPIWMWISMIVPFLVFAFFATQLRYEEDIAKLLPKTEKSEASGLAFGQLSIKDKIFVQMERQSDSVMPEQMAELCDLFIDTLLAPDSCNHLIKHVLYRIEDEWMVNGLDYALEHFPSLVDTSVYPSFDSLLAPATIAKTMKSNAEELVDNPDGTLSMVIPYDPANLRSSLVKLFRQRPTNTITLDRHFFSHDSSVVIAYVTPNAGSFESKKCDKVVSHIAKMAKHFSKDHPEVKVVYHGAPVLSAGNSRRIKTDIAITISISLLIILVVIMLCYRNKSTVGMILVPLIYGTIFAMACVYWIKPNHTMSIMALGLAAPILGIAMSYILHVLTHYKYVSNPITVLREQATPVCLSCLTTIGAFAGLLFTTSELLQDFGIFASIALVGTTFFALAYMPQFFNLERNIHNRKAFGYIERINAYSLDRCYWLVALICVVAVVSVVISYIPSTKVKFDNDLQHIGYKTKTVVQSMDLYQQRINQGAASKFYAATSTDLDSAIMQNRQLVAKLDRLQSDSVVRLYSGVSSMLLPIAEQESNIQHWQNYWTPGRVANVQRAVARSAKANGLDKEIFDPFFALVESEYDAESIYDSGILPDELACNYVEKVTETTKTDTADKYLVFTSVLTAPEDAYKVADSLTSLSGVIIADPFYYTGDMVNIVHNDFNIVLLISSIFVIVVLLISYRSIVMALLAFLPMFLSWYIVQGVMSVCGLEFNLINIVLSSFIFGVGVDYSIFISNGLITSEKGNNMKLLTHHKTAITFSAFILIVVLGSLLLATHPSLHSVGLCSLIGMASTILISYCLQPFLFRQLMKVKFLRKRILHLK